MFKAWLDFSFWFNPRPSIDFQFKKPMLIFAISLLFFSFFYLTILYLLFKNSKAYSILREHVFYFLFTTSLLLILVWFFRSQGVVYLAAPIAFLVVGLIALGWLLFIIRTIFKTFLPLLRTEREWQRKSRYLPRGRQK